MRPLLPKSNRADSINDSNTPPLPKAPGKEGQQSEFRVPAVRGSSDSGSGIDSQGTAKDKPKRIVVSNACVPCRKRRSKVR